MREAAKDDGLSPEGEEEEIAKILCRERRLPEQLVSVPILSVVGSTAFFFLQWSVIHDGSAALWAHFSRDNKRCSDPVRVRERVVRGVAVRIGHAQANG